MSRACRSLIAVSWVIAGCASRTTVVERFLEDARLARPTSSYWLHGDERVSLDSVQSFEILRTQSLAEYVTPWSSSLGAGDATEIAAARGTVHWARIESVTHDGLPATRVWTFASVADPTARCGESITALFQENEEQGTLAAMEPRDLGTRLRELAGLEPAVALDPVPSSGVSANAAEALAAAVAPDPWPGSGHPEAPPPLPPDPLDLRVTAVEGTSLFGVTLGESEPYVLDFPSPAIGGAVAVGRVVRVRWELNGERLVAKSVAIIDDIPQGGETPPSLHELSEPSDAERDRAGYP
ncbi:MAG: hypothetical protein U0166_24665 [Acidobacteriota bacterium]